MNRLHPWGMITRAAESGLVPDPVVRRGIRRLLSRRLRELSGGSGDDRYQRLHELIAAASHGPIAPVPDLANKQHYEVPAEFFRCVLGPRLKYSCCYWPEGVEALAQAEEAALRLTCTHAGIEDGVHVLDLGCGWGSLSLWMAEQYPGSTITAVSNSASQRQFIASRAAAQGIHNLTVITADINEFDTVRRFDRIVSVEMFEHVRNHQELLRRISDWLAPEGRLFVHVFCHRTSPYFFEFQGPQDWMAEHFFTGGMMPSESLLAHYDRHLQVMNQWRWEGAHYARTCRAWLNQMDAQLETIRPLFECCYGQRDAKVWIQRWRLFFMACEELFAFNRGQEWYVTHLLMERPQRHRRTVTRTASLPVQA